MWNGKSHAVLGCLIVAAVEYYVCIVLVTQSVCLLHFSNQNRNYSTYTLQHNYYYFEVILWHFTIFYYIIDCAAVLGSPYASAHVCQI